MVVWLAFAFLLITTAVGIAYAVVRGLGLWRDVKRAGGRFTEQADRMTAKTAEIEGHLAAAQAASGRLQDAAARLADSRARLGVQLAAIGEARSQVQRMLWFAPRRR